MPKMPKLIEGRFCIAKDCGRQVTTPYTGLCNRHLRARDFDLCIRSTARYNLAFPQRNQK